MGNDLFRFMTIRPPQRVSTNNISRKIVLAYGLPGNESPLHLDLKKIEGTQDAREKMIERANQYIASSEFISDLNNLSMPFDKFDQWIIDRKPPIKLEDISEGIKQIFTLEASRLVQSNNYKSDRQHVADSLIALSISIGYVNQSASQLLIRLMRLFGLIERIASNDTSLGERMAIEKALNAIVLLPEDLFPLPTEKSSDRRINASEEKRNKMEEHRKYVENISKQMRDIETTIDEVTKGFESDIIEYRKNPNTMTGIEVIPSEHLNFETSIENDNRGAMASIVFNSAKNHLILAEKSVEKLSLESKKVLNDLGIPLDYVEVTKTIDTLEKEMASLTSKLYKDRPFSDMVMIGNVYYPANVFFNPVTLEVVPILPSIPHGVGVARPIGIADLMVVKQEILKYQPGEVSHIENILKGESKDRKHRRTLTTEETYLLETERTEETERDLQSTGRFELQREVQNTLNENVHSEATGGINVTAKYGVTVQIEASANAHMGFSSDTAIEDSKRTSTSFAHEVTDRTVSRIQEHVREQRFRRTVEEIEEINSHGFDNKSGSDHIIGIYRWIDKIYTNQVVNYGKRMMFEFVIPEPAAFFKFAEATKPKESVTIEKPDPPGYSKGSNFHPLRPSDIGPYSYLRWAGKYNVTDVEPPPPFFKVVGSSITDPAATTSNGSYVPPKEKKDLNIPDGYVPSQVFWNGRYWYWLSDELNPKIKHEISVLIGGDAILTLSDLQGYFNNFQWDRIHQNPLPISVLPLNIAAYAINLEIICKRTEELYNKWQLKTYNSIMTGYQKLKDRYDDQLAAVQVQQGVAIHGRNPLENREIEKTELKKASISMITGQYFDLFDAMLYSGQPFGYPQMDISEANQEGNYIQFFEQAFEWVNMTYIFYPYFWGQKEKWRSNMLLDDNDPLFAKFLQAGAARVQVPVRLGYEEAILHFINTGGDIWNGGGSPQVCNPNDPNCLYLSILDEIKEQQDAEFVQGEGMISVSTGSSTVTGIATKFAKEDIDREILIERKRYRVADIVSPTKLILTENYRGQTRDKIHYSFGVKFVGDPWELKLPTSLVILQKDSSLPDWSSDGTVS